MCLWCHLCSRRQFVTAAGMLPLIACAGAPTENVVPDAPPAGVELTPTTIRVRLDQAAGLTKTGGSLVIGEATTIVINAASGDYRAYSNVCPHAGCGIYEFANARIRCGCHGSTFDIDGGLLEGPATTGLARRQSSVEGTILTITR